MGGKATYISIYTHSGSMLGIMHRMTLARLYILFLSFFLVARTTEYRIYGHFILYKHFAGIRNDMI